VLAGAGAALLPRAMADLAAPRGAVVVPLVPALRRSIALVYRPGTLSPAAARFREIAHDVVAPTTGTGGHSSGMASHH
jgi:DNA-binding transcriptional LysR family regulator